MRLRNAVALALATSLLPATAGAQNKAPPAAGKPADPEAEAKRKDEARKYFEKGLLLFDDEAWDGALAEFLRSREIYPGRAATKNAAICLRKLKRFDESLDLFEQVLAMPGISADDKQIANREIATLRGLVGTVEVKGAEAGATVIVDGRNRGSAPVPALRVTVGTHVVRVYKEGFEAFEARIDVAGGAAVPVQAKLAPLLKSGRLKVNEKGGKSVTVVVDGAVVGKTPWEGPLAPGDHTVILRGEGDLGTQPATVPVTLNQVTPLTLVAESLNSSLRVQPTPNGASVAIDGVSVGRGSWDGRLRAGAHKIEIAAEGFLPQTREMSLVAGKPEVLTVSLDRDPNSPLWTENRGRFFLEIDPAFGLLPALGGEVASGCTAPCSKGLGLGFMALGKGGYRFRGGFVLGLEAGYLFLQQSVTGRATTVTPMGLPNNPGKVDDKLTLSGPVLGAAAGVRVGFKVPLTFRLGAGAFLGSLKDHRTGSFSTVARAGKPATSYKVDETESPAATSVYISPEVRVGMRLGQHFELSLGAQAMVLIVLSSPKWTPNDRPVLAATDGQGTFPSETLAGKVAVVVTPGIGAKYDF